MNAHPALKRPARNQLNIALVRKALFVFFIASTLACNQTGSDGRAGERQHAADGVYQATAYSIEDETRSGRQVRKGHVAADSDVLPIGTRIEISDAGPYSGVYTVTDTGRKIRGREIDIYLPNDGEAKQFGRKQVRVRVLELPAEKGGR